MRILVISEMGNQAWVRASVAFLIGSVLALGLAAVSLAALLVSPLKDFPELRYDCWIIGIAEPNCAAGAQAAAIWNFVGFAIVFCFALWSLARSNRGQSAPRPLSPAATELLLACCACALLAHVTLREIGPAYASRTDELLHFGHFISLENVFWPLLIQLLLIEQSLRLKTMITALLLVIASLSIFRTAVLTIFLFAFLLPAIFALVEAYRASWSRAALIPAFGRSAIMLLAALSLMASLATDSQSRVLSTNAQIAALAPPQQESEPNAELSAGQRLRQRLIIPFYQAAITREIATTTRLPSILDEIAEKFRLSSKPTLSEAVYRQIEPRGIGSINSLFYGEGAAYFGSFGWLWTILAPSLFVLAWLGLNRLGVEASALLSVQLWRSFFAGLVTLLPALCVQLAALFLLTSPGRFKWFKWANDRRALAVGGACLMSASFAAAAVQGWALVTDAQRGSLLRLELDPSTGCEFDTSAIPDLAGRVDELALNIGRPSRAVVTSYTAEHVYLLMPYRDVMTPHISDIIDRASAFVVCSQGSNEAPVHVAAQNSISSIGFLPLKVLALTATLLAALLQTGIPIGPRLAPALGLLLHRFRSRWLPRPGTTSMM
jgi:hypothetical protein